MSSLTLTATSSQSGELPLPPSGWRGFVPCATGPGPAPRSSDSKGSHDGTGEALRHDLAGRHAGRGDVALGGEKAARRARARRARRADDRGRLSRARNPKEVELFERLAELELEQATICAFGMTRRRDAAAEDDEALRDPGRLLRAVVTLVGKTWALHLEKVTKVSREENLAMIADSVGFCREQRQAGRLRRRALLRRLPRRPRLRARLPRRGGRRRGRERHPLRHQRRQPARPGRRGDRGRRRGARRGGRGRHPRPRRRRVRRSPTRWPRSTRGRGWSRARVNGYGERCGNANLTSILPALQLKMGFDVVSAEQLATLADDRPLPRRALQPRLRTRPRPTSAATPSPTRGGCTSPGSRPTPSTFEHLDPATVGNQRDVLRLRALRQGDDPRPGRAGRAGDRRRGAPRGRSSG